MAGETLPIKIGTWGGNGGNEFDIKDKEPPVRLESITIRSGSVIDSFGYTYVDQEGKKHTAGPYGGHGGKPTTIQFAPTEYVKRFAGSTGNGVVATLLIETNLKTYEIYDREPESSFLPGTNIPWQTQHTVPKPPFNIPLSDGNVPFSVPVPENFSIVGFYGRAGGSLDAIGVYVRSSSSQDNSSPQPLTTMDGEIAPVKIGAWGGDGGKTFDVTKPPRRLESVTIRAGDMVDSFGFSYVDQAGEKHIVGPCGGTGGKIATIQFGPTEYVKKFSGTIGWHGGPRYVFDKENFAGGGGLAVASLEIETNMQTYGPYGKATNNPFSIAIPADDAGVVGFFGRAGGVIDAIGVYISNSKFPLADATKENSPPPLIITKEAKPIKIGAWGGDGGIPFDVTQPPKRLESVTIRAGSVLDAIGFSYVDQAGQKHTEGPFGGPGGNLYTIELEPSEYVTKVYGTVGDYNGYWVVASLTIETNIRTYGTYGTDQSSEFSIPLPEDASIVGFFGRGGGNLDAIGVYVSGSIPN